MAFFKDRHNCCFLIKVQKLLWIIYHPIIFWAKNAIKIRFQNIFVIPKITLEKRSFYPDNKTKTHNKRNKREGKCWENAERCTFGDQG